jgi:hypothetical protein
LANTIRPSSFTNSSNAASMNFMAVWESARPTAAEPQYEGSAVCAKGTQCMFRGIVGHCDAAMLSGLNERVGREREKERRRA